MQRSPLLPVVYASAVVLAVYLAVLAVLPLDVFWHPDEGAKYIAVETVRFDGPYSVPYAGARLDPDLRFYPGHKIYPARARRGGVRFHWPALFPLMARPFLGVFGAAGLYVVPVLSGCLTAFLAGVWALRFLPSAAPIAVLLVGLASPIAFYSLGFFEHTLTTLIAAAALTLAIARPGRGSALALAAPLLALAAVLRIEMLAFAAAFAGAWGMALAARAAWEPRGLLRGPRQGSVVLGIIALAVLVVGTVLVAGLVPARHLARLDSIPQEILGMWHNRHFFFDTALRIFFGDPGFADFTLLRSWQIVALCSLFGLMAAPFVDSRPVQAALLLPSLFVLLQTSLLTVIGTVPFLQRQGVLAVAPYIGVALYGVPLALRRRDPALLTLSATGFLYAAFSFLLIFATRVANHDGTTLLGLDGAVRYMIMLYPMGAVLALVALADWRSEGGATLVSATVTGLLVGMMLLALAYEARGFRELALKRGVLVQWRQEIRKQEPVLTDEWWLPAVLAPYFVGHEMYVLNRPEDLEAWLQAATREGVTVFTFASQSPLPARLLEGGLDARDTQSVPDLNLTRIRFPAGGG